MSQRIYEDLLHDDNLYRARYYVLNATKIDSLDGISGIGSKSSNYVHVIIDGTDSLMLAIAQQVALIAHYPNHNEQTHTFRSVIAIVGDEPSKEELQNTFGNLLQYAHCQYIDTMGNIQKETSPDSYLDITLRFVQQPVEEYLSKTKKDNKAIISLFTYRDIQEVNMNVVVDKNKPLTAEERMVDITRARKANRIYEFVNINNYENTREQERVDDYMGAIKRCISGFRVESELQQAWDKLGDNAIIKLSNVCCGDCYESRMRSLGRKWRVTLLQDFTLYAKSEHIRWCTEKLIFGYRPFNEEELRTRSALAAKDKEKEKAFLTQRKKNKVHYNICSNAGLYSRDYEAIRYDTFLILVTPFLEKTSWLAFLKKKFRNYL